MTVSKTYAYCSNNPVMGYDPLGEATWWQCGKGMKLWSVYPIE
jgi:hypothetical protein